MSSPIVDLRGPCGHLVGRLDTARLVIQRKCPECSRAAGSPVYHWFDAVSGRVVDTQPFGEASPDPESSLDRETA